jgi:hypothetical protein
MNELNALEEAMVATMQYDGLTRGKQLGDLVPPGTFILDSEGKVVKASDEVKPTWLPGGIPPGYPGYVAPVYVPPGYAHPGYAHPGYAHPDNEEKSKFSKALRDPTTLAVGAAGILATILVISLLRR